ncbi:MAG TPA: penicillin-binding protein 2 [Atribacteraceae bacterium]|nr:penicillin-binding protein 2 [Atribacteraceae bacterium]
MNSRKFVHRTNFLVFLLFTFLFYIGFRLYTVQITYGDVYRQRANLIRMRVEDLVPPRGKILDRHNEAIARDFEAISVYALPSLIVNPEETAKHLARILTMDQEELFVRLKSPLSFVWIQRKVPLYLEEVLRKENLPGIEWRRENIRFYPQAPRLSNLVGFVGTDHRGLEGVEFTFDQELTGEVGFVTYERDATGREIPGSTGFLNPKPGNDVILTIDSSIQFFAERALDQAMESTKAKRGVVVVNDPRSGDILAMVARPTFDNSHFWAYDPDKWRNLAIGMVFEPGSTVKPLVVAASLEEKLTHPQEAFYCPGHIMVYNHRMRDINAHGDLKLEEIIADSCNVGVIQLAQRLGEERLFRYLKDFGIGEPTKLPLEGEESGLLRPFREWSALSIGAVPIGQEMLVTPLQLLKSLSAIANQGVLMHPRIVQRVQTLDGEPVREHLPAPAGRVISADTAWLVLHMMEKAAEEGTGKRAVIPGYRIGGKTGTGQKIGPDGLYMADRFVSSFAGFFPLPDPQIGIVVVLDEAQGAFYGGEIATPVFRDIAQNVINYLGIPSQDAEVRIY